VIVGWAKKANDRPRSVDRTRSPIGVSQKREYFKYQPETIDDFALRLSKFGVQRRSTNLQKAAIGGHFSDLYVHNLQLPDWGWLTWEGSNSHIPNWKKPIEMSGEFPSFPRNSSLETFAATSCGF
jgi:hypothetical protein